MGFLFIMFASDNQKVIAESRLSRKKKIFTENIRRKEKLKTFELLRQKALFPQDISHHLNRLPESLPQIVRLVDHHLPEGWHLSIADKLHQFCLDSPEFFTGKRTPELQVGLTIYIMAHKTMDCEAFEELWLRVYKSSLNWPQGQQTLLLKVLRVSMERIDSKYLDEAKIILQENQKRLDSNMFSFYDFLLKNHMREAFEKKVLSNELFGKIADNLKICFYSTSEKVQMVELLVQILYLGDSENITEHWDLPHLFDILEFFFGEDCKLLIQRSLMLIFNLNITRTSKIFLAHPCAEMMLWELQNSDIPIKLRELMAETYLSALVNLLPKDLPKYISKHSEIIEKFLVCIVQELNQSQAIMGSLEEVIWTMLKMEEEGSDFQFNSWLTSHPQVLQALRSTPLGMSLLEDCS